MIVFLLVSHVCLGMPTVAGSLEAYNITCSWDRTLGAIATFSTEALCKAKGDKLVSYPPTIDERYGVYIEDAFRCEPLTVIEK